MDAGKKVIKLHQVFSQSHRERRAWRINRKGAKDAKKDIGHGFYFVEHRIARMEEPETSRDAVGPDRITSGPIWSSFEG